MKSYRILVDADACPVKDIILKHAKKNEIAVLMFTNTCVNIDDGYSTVFVVDKSKDGADIALANKLKKGDIVVTQDYGVAAMALGKSAFALNQNGLIYSDDNIDRLLFERHLGQKVRRSGGRTSNVPKRTKEDDSKFETAFLSLINKVDTASVL